MRFAANRAHPIIEPLFHRNCCRWWQLWCKHVWCWRFYAVFRTYFKERMRSASLKMGQFCARDVGKWIKFLIVKLHKTSPLLCKGVSQFPWEPCSSFNYMLLKGHVERKIHPYVRGVTKIHNGRISRVPPGPKSPKIVLIVQKRPLNFDFAVNVSSGHR